jgi:hypothetical protein
VAIGRSGCGPEPRFDVHVRYDNGTGRRPLVRLKTLCGQDDDGSPCITITTMMPDEDD